MKRAAGGVSAAAGRADGRRSPMHAFEGAATDAAKKGGTAEGGGLSSLCFDAWGGSRYFIASEGIMMEKTMDKVVALCKGRGFVYPGSEIYGGLANTWDYGPLGVEMKNNVKKAWWLKFVQESPYNVGVDCAILMNPQVWVASGHVGGFSDPLMDCKSCKARFRADKIIEDFCAGSGLSVHVEGMKDADMEAFIAEKAIPCPQCGARNFTGIRKFNLMFKTFQGVTEDSQAAIFLRPETAQGIFVNFKNVLRTTRRKIPFGIAQIGKAFRNEITPGNFTFRTREFEQMELEFFCEPGSDLEWFAYWKSFCHQWLLSLGMDKDSVRARDHAPEELSHYSNATTDFEFLFPFGWGELWGIADRTDFDLMQHAKHSGEALEYLDPVTGAKFVPYCIEPSLGVDRVMLAFLCNAYDEETLEGGDVRTVMRLHPALAPVKAAILPLQKKLGEKAQQIHARLSKSFMVDYDESGSIGKRYRRQDEAGTPWCVTIDFDTLEDDTVTIRERDSMQQIRLPQAELEAFIAQRIAF
jgi:glycyl-tRNA synthetase